MARSPHRQFIHVCHLTFNHHNSSPMLTRLSPIAPRLSPILPHPPPSSPILPPIFSFVLHIVCICAFPLSHPRPAQILVHNPESSIDQRHQCGSKVSSALPLRSSPILHRPPQAPAQHLFLPVGPFPLPPSLSPNHSQPKQSALPCVLAVPSGTIQISNLAHPIHPPGPIFGISFPAITVHIAVYRTPGRVSRTSRGVGSGPSPALPAFRCSIICSALAPCWPVPCGSAGLGSI